jgi:type IV pilus assembly protein PilY1
MKHKYSVLILSLLTVVSLGVSAHDTDIYINTSGGPSTSDPLVMFTLDLRASGSASSCPTGETKCDFLYANDDLNGGLPYLTVRGIKQMEVLKAVIKYVVNRVSGVKVGLMLNHAQNNNCAGPTATGCSNGGYILYGFQPLTDKANFFAKLNAVPTDGGNTAHPYQGRELYFELFRYLTGQGVYNGKLGYKDYGNNSASGNLDTESPSLAWDTSIISGSNYIAPAMDDCTKIYAVNFLFGNSQSEGDSDTAIAGTVAGGGLGANPSTLYSYNPDGTFAPMVRWMYEHDMTNKTGNYAPNTAGTKSVTSYFIIPGNPVSTTRNIASAGQGQAGTSLNPYLYSDDPEALVISLTNLFQRILSTSTTFTAPAVAVNVYNRAQTLSDVYFAMFQADQAGKPLWTGNLKKFTISGLQVLDATGTQAIAGDGRVENTALSYWTDPSAPSLLTFNNANGIFAGKDGRHVARGGCGQRIPGWEDTGSTPGLTNPGGNTTLTTTRKLFTEPAGYTNGASTALLALEATTSTAGALFSPTNYFGAGTTAVGTCLATDTDNSSACNLIKYARGLNDDNTQRSWLVADSLHSKPLPVNYGAINGHSTSNPEVRIIMGTNDGYLRMIRNTSASGAQEGIEAWAFMPREAMSTLATLKTNATASPISHPITVDGAPTAYVKDVNKNGNIETGDKVYVYFGMRRGGKSYYALDASDPDDPKILWKINKNDAGGAFAELGETWSTPRVVSMLVNGSNTPTPVLIFGGGYDTNKDISHLHHAGTATVGTNDSQGNAIFIVHAETGALIWKAVKGTTTGYNSSTGAYTHPDLVDSIPSDVAAVDSNGNGLIDRLYVGDTGGVVWRVDTKCSHPSGVNVVSGNASPGCGATTSDAQPWKIIPILSVGRHDSSSVVNDRRFFYPPDYVQSVDASGTYYDGVIVGTGDRENPKSTGTTDWFYMFKDKDRESGTLSYNTGTPRSHSDLDDITNCAQASCTTSLINGWRLKLECPTEAFSTPCGEKNLSASVTIGGIVYFSTYIPKDGLSNNCQLLEGSGALYMVDVQDGKPVCTTTTCNPGTLGKNDRADKVTSGGIPAEIVQLGGGRILKPGSEGDIAGKLGYPPGLKTYWYKK